MRAQAPIPAQAPAQAVMMTQPMAQPPIQAAIPPPQFAHPAQLAAPVQTTNPIANQSLSTYLAELNLSHYELALRELGVATPSDLVDLQQDDCEAIGMKKLEAKRLLRIASAGATTV